MYLRRASQDSRRVRVIDSGQNISQIQKELEVIMTSI
jgi:thymidylate kinase